ncbi:PREDICTED: poly(rC)-binding protein 3-like [Fragaria vesca subsp. vesca]
MGSTFLSLPAKRSICSTMSSENGSSKRARPRQQQQQLPVPPGHVSFRMLCHASRIGGVIGKSGAVIKQLQVATGAKIRIEEPPQVDSPDRVVVVTAPSAVRSKVVLNGLDEIEVSKAQEALLRVFERILEVAAESGAIGIGVGVVSCRFLADAAQVGSVIGKGGKVVEKIRKDTGCKIRVLNDKLPVCAAPSDQMVEIEGDILAVKKALVAVSARLQDCPRDTLPEIRVVISSLPSSSYVSGVSVEAESIPTLDARTLQQEVTFRILCANDRAGGVIGKGGAIVRALQNETGATISVGGSVADSDERLITITASENPESRYSPAQKAVVLVFSRSVEAGIEKGQDSSSKGSPLVARLVVPTSQVGCLLGKGGVIVSEIRKVTSTGIRIIRGDQVPKCASENDQVVQVNLQFQEYFSNVQDALYNITGRLRDNLFSSGVNNLGRRNSSAVLTDSNPYGRLRDPAPIVFQPTSSTGVTHGLGRHTTLSQSMDHLGLSHNLDHPSSPKPWASHMVAPRGISDTRGLTNLKIGSDLGSGSKSAIVTNTTVEIIVPENVIGSVYGENGTNLARLRQISGAKVIVHEPRPGTTDRIIVISGTPDESQAAQSLLHAFILTGPS